MVKGRHIIVLLFIYSLSWSCNSPLNLLKSSERRHQDRAIKLLDRARKLSPDLFKDSSVTKIHWIDSIKVTTKDSVIVKEKVQITGETLIVCDTIEGKPKPFDQWANTGMVRVHMWIDTAGKFHYDINQDSVIQRFKELENRSSQVRDSIHENYITVPKIIYRMKLSTSLICGAVGIAIGFFLLWIINLIFRRRII